MAIASSPSTPHVTAAGTRAGPSAWGSAASVDALGVESSGDSAAEADGSSPALVGESLGDSPRSEPSSDRSSPFFALSSPAFPGAALRAESPGDSLASGDSEGDPEGDEDVVGELDDGLADGLVPEPPAPPEALVGDGDGLLG